ncbi:MAG: hypothetical protein MJ180_00935 [Candidatus Gastranaerophilales bacterium]|nr:hypothetical protein [Candidatus Gastranaerophilales bacterium]
MGLSASQTRYLSLTARKSNVEYQGQQVNEARTGLANQSADLYKQMINLKAPIAPTIYDYIINPATLPNIDWADDTAWPLNSAKQKNFEIYYAANQPSFQSFGIPEYKEYADEKTGRKYWAQVGYDEKGKEIAGGIGRHYSYLEDVTGTYCVKMTSEEDGSYNKKGKDVAGNFVSYTSIHVDENEKFEYDAESGLFQIKEEYKDSFTYEELAKNIKAFNLAMGTYNTYSKPDKIKIYDHDLSQAEQDALKDTNTENDPVPVSYKRSATENYDTAQYNAAMVKYEQEQREYEEILAEINAKTEEIHQADEKLELQLKQLDTEQEAINTEMEAVKKVIEKNIEQTFKTFA